MSFSDIQIQGAVITYTFEGLKHWANITEDTILPAAVRNTLVFVVVVVVVEVILGLGLTLLLSKVKKLTSAYRTILFFPLLIPPIAMGTMWRLMYDYNYGLINQILALINITGPTWTADKDLALLCIIVVDIWHWTSFLFLLILAGFESLPHELAEAAKVDGAGEWQTIRYIFLPLLKPTIITATMLRTIMAFKVFDQIYLLTGGGPGTATEVLNLYIFKVYFTQNRLGYGAVLALLLAMLMTAFVLIYKVVGRRIGKE
jgi:multiple sugar transport system permease protein